MIRLACLVLVLAACEPAHPAAPAAHRHAAARTRAIELSIARVEQEGWTGRVVRAQVPLSGHRLRVIGSDRPRPLAEIVAQSPPPRPFAAICGGFYDLEGRAMGLVIADGRTLSPKTEQGGRGIFFYETGRADIVHRDAFEERPAIDQALQSIDRLVDEGANLVATTASQRRAARSAVAIDRSGDVFLVVAFDERAIATATDAEIQLDEDSSRTGPTLWQMAELLRAPPAEGGVSALRALGLDGGVATSMMFKSEARSLSVIAHRATIGAIVAFREPGDR
ncbi:MAG: phosphodiester glycosidase family protein [Sandaracinaceae bacterium]|nr:phosphodiester glycosidase family protein [Sandaracinaceae bacterium]